MLNESPKILISPSILPVLDKIAKEEKVSIREHYSIVATEVSQLIKNKADIEHFDIMDGKYVKRKTFGDSLDNAVEWVQRLSEINNVHADVHLMIKEPPEMGRKIL